MSIFSGPTGPKVPFQDIIGLRNGRRTLGDAIESHAKDVALLRGSSVEEERKRSVTLVCKTLCNTGVLSREDVEAFCEEYLLRFNGKSPSGDFM